MHELERLGVMFLVNGEVLTYFALPPAAKKGKKIDFAERQDRIDSLLVEVKSNRAAAIEYVRAENAKSIKRGMN